MRQQLSNFMRKKSQQVRRKRRVRAKVSAAKARPRLSVYRSNKYIYAQLIDALRGVNIASANEKDLKLSGKGKSKTKIDKAGMVGEVLAKKAKRKKISKVVFDRASYKYHGRVKALAEGARKGGLKF